MKNNETWKWIILAILAIIWGTSFILIKKSVEFINPFTVGAIRVFMAGIFLVPFGIMYFRKIPKASYKWILLTGLLGNFIPMFLFPIAEKKLSSSIAGILNSLVPVFVIWIGYLFYKQKTTRKHIIGTIIGFIGACILIFGSHESNNHLDLQTTVIDASIIVVATIMYAFSALIIKTYLTAIPSFQLSSVLFSLYAIPSLVIIIYQETQESFLFQPAFNNGIVYVALLGILGTAIANILFYKLIQNTSAVFASSVTYLMPIVAVLWGILYGENVQIQHFTGMFVILLGVYLIKEKE